MSEVRAGAPPAIVAITAILLAGYLGVAVWGLASPSSDPQRGMAQGCLTLFGIVVLALCGLLWLGAKRRYRWLVWTIFGICAAPSLSLLARGIYLLVRSIQGS